MSTLDKTTLAELMGRVLRFREERRWAPFHTPKNLATALGIECAELQEVFLWKTDAEVAELLGSERKQAVRDELADVMIYLLYLAEACEIDLAEAVVQKLELNAVKYPADKSRGSAKKYTEYDD